MRAGNCSPPASPTRSGGSTPCSPTPLGAGPPQLRMEARARTHLRNYFTRHDPDLLSAPLEMKQVPSSLTRQDAAAPAVSSQAAAFELSRPAGVEASPSMICTNPEEAFCVRPRPHAVLPITGRLRPAR